MRPTGTGLCPHEPFLCSRLTATRTDTPVCVRCFSVTVAEIGIAPPRGEFYQLADSSSRHWCSLNIPNEKLTDANVDARSAVASMCPVLQILPQGIKRFRSAIEQLDEAVQSAPVAAFESDAAQMATAQKLVREISNVLDNSHDATHVLGRHDVPRGQIIHRAMEFVEQDEGDCASLGQLASSVGVSERTLRNEFLRYFGVGPVQYLTRRALRQIQRALKAADPSQTTVTEIAGHFGVWQFGRLARDYRLVFGELPSVTLRRLDSERCHEAGLAAIPPSFTDTDTDTDFTGLNDNCA